ncbi:MAG: hypothetical protein GF372_03235, partial [Candidatus Marinimicrobia bacterium]|nr:hypothetical protein [Candidatus Neomarinimicrobiota bacterium]
MKYFLSCVILFLAVNTCGKSVTEPELNPQAQLLFDFEGEFQDWIDLGGSGESAFDSDISLTEKFSSSGNKSVKFTVSSESYVANGNRAELTYDDGASEGSDKWYSWKIYLPEDYPDVSMRDNQSEPNWQIMGQWHQQPVVEDGETWEEFTGKGESPPVGMNYYFLGKDDSYYQNLKSDEAMRSVPGYDPNWDDVSVFFITYGTP